MLLLGLVLQENYPFSNFPMYSSFNSHTYLVYLVDARGKMLGRRELGLSNSGLKKIFDGYRRKELAHLPKSNPERVAVAEKEAGRSLFQYLDGLTKPRPQARALLNGAGLRHVLITQKGQSLDYKTTTLVQHP